MGMIPKTTKAETKAVFNMSMQRMIGAMLALALAFFVGRLFVHVSLQGLFMAIAIALYFLLNIRLSSNPKKRLWQGIVSYLQDQLRPKHYISVIGYAYSQAQGGDIVVQKTESREALQDQIKKTR